jgi:hypothetical protein
VPASSTSDEACSDFRTWNFCQLSALADFSFVEDLRDSEKSVQISQVARWFCGVWLIGEKIIAIYCRYLHNFGAKRFSSAFSIGRLGYGRFYQAFSNKNVSERQKGKFSLDDSTEMDLGSV